MDTRIFLIIQWILLFMHNSQSRLPLQVQLVDTTNARLLEQVANERVLGKLESKEVLSSEESLVSAADSSTRKVLKAKVDWFY